MCVYVCESESEHILGYLLWIHSICTVCSPRETRCHYSQQSGSVFPRNRTIGLRFVVFQLALCCCFFINILKDYFTVSVYSHYCPNDCRKVMVNFGKWINQIYHNGWIKGITHQRLSTVNISESHYCWPVESALSNASIFILNKHVNNKQHFLTANILHFKYLLTSFENMSHHKAFWWYLFTIKLSGAIFC